MVTQQSDSVSAEAFNLSAILGEEEVSDVSYQRSWAERSEDSVQVSQQSDGISTEASYNSRVYTVGSLEFEVDGSLDEGELKAIGDLLQGVDELSQTFFDGDIAAAYEQALQLGYDKTEIAGYALELKDREYSYAEQRYRAAGEINQPTIPKGMFRPIGNYMESLNSLAEVDNQQFDGQLLEKLMERVDENREAEEHANRNRASFTAFNFELLQQYQSLQFSLNV